MFRTMIDRDRQLGLKALQSLASTRKSLGLESFYVHLDKVHSGQS